MGLEISKPKRKYWKQLTMNEITDYSNHISLETLKKKIFGIKE